MSFFVKNCEIILLEDAFWAATVCLFDVMCLFAFVAIFFAVRDRTCSQSLHTAVSPFLMKMFL